MSSTTPRAIRAPTAFVVPNANSVAILIRPNASLRQAEVEVLGSQVEKAVARREVKGAKEQYVRQAAACATIRTDRCGARGGGRRGA